MLRLILNTLVHCTLLIVILTGCGGGGGGGGGNGGNSLSVNLECDAIDVDYDSDVTLTWSSTNADSCTASGSWQGDKGTSGSETVSALTEDCAFTITCTDSNGGTANDMVSVTVGPQHPGTASLSWTPPTTNTDDSPLTDLAGYKIYFGTNPNNYTETITVNDSGIDSYVVDNLAAATWYFAVSAFDTSGNESVRSNEATKVISTE